VIGYLLLRLIEQFLKLADAQRTVAKQVQDAKPGAVTETLINLDEIHGE
jgi:hypothetical protein